jgi:hypothetical protein
MQPKVTWLAVRHPILELMKDKYIKSNTWTLIF